MVGFLIWRAAGRPAVELRREVLLGRPFLVAEVLRRPGTPEFLLHRRVRRAAGALLQGGVRQAALPEGFSYEKELGALRPVSTLPTRRALAPEWVDEALARRGLPAADSRVAVCAGEVTAEGERAVRALSRRHRYVLLEAAGGETLCRALRREGGVSLVLRPDEKRLAEAEALVLFWDRPGLPRRNPVVLSLYEETAPLPPLRWDLEAALPPGTDRAMGLAALWSAGALGR